jgi:serine/threonine protein kinase
MEYAQHGDLNDCMKEPLPEYEARIIAHQIVEALEILHQRRWAHRDLKPSVSSAVISCLGANLEQNVFVIQRGPDWWVKLGDFGVSKSLANDMTQLRTNIDTDFTAPEIIGFPGAGSAEASSYTNAADLWSLGFLVHWLLTLKLPLTRKEMGEFCIGALPSLPQQHLQEQYITNSGIQFILTLLRPQPLQRPSAYHLKEHKWLQEGITQTSPMPDHSIPEQPWFAPQLPAINHAAVNKTHFAEFSPTSSTPTRTSQSRAYLKQQTAKTEASKEAAEQNLAISPNLSQKEAALPQVTMQTAIVEEHEHKDPEPLTQQLNPADRWAQIRKKAAERAQRQAEEPGRRSHNETRTDNGESSGEESKFTYFIFSESVLMYHSHRVSR